VVSLIVDRPGRGILTEIIGWLAKKKAKVKDEIDDSFSNAAESEDEGSSKVKDPKPT
jgi:hypothetical protein